MTGCHTRSKRCLPFLSTCSLLQTFVHVLWGHAICLAFSIISVYVQYFLIFAHNPFLDVYLRTVEKYIPYNSARMVCDILPAVDVTAHAYVSPVLTYLTWNTLTRVYEYCSNRRDRTNEIRLPGGPLSWMSFCWGVGKPDTEQLNIVGCPGFTRLFPK